MRRNFFRWIPTIIYSGVIFFLSGQTHNTSSSTVNVLAHFLEFGLFACAIVWGVTSGFLGDLTLKRTVWIFVAVVIYAVSDEFHQSFVPGREASVGDVIVDTAGAASFLLLIYLFKRGK